MPRYAAFISYSHQDERHAAWLHRAVETFRVPRRLQRGGSVEGRQGRIGPVFRDRTELPTTSDLDSSVRESIAQSENLIVLCSPASARSRWVAEEILVFKRLHGEDRIHCLITDGEPLAGDEDDPDGRECFAEPLRYRIAADGSLSSDRIEPVAADLRPDGDGRRLALLKVVAGLLEVGLDDLIQRDSLRRVRRLWMLTAGSVAGMAVAGALAIVAVEAREDAERRRAQAEDLIEFMLTDLDSQLRPVGRLEVLDAVGEKALEYYAEAAPADLDDGSLGRRSRALLLLGEIDNLRGNINQSHAVFEEANRITREGLARAPGDPQRIFEHAQTVFWLGYIDFQRGRLDEAEDAFLEYQALAQSLVEIEPDNVDYQAEVAMAGINLSGLWGQEGRSVEAAAAVEMSRHAFAAILEQNPDDTETMYRLAQSTAFLADSYRAQGRFEVALAERTAELALYRDILDIDPQNYPRRLNMVVCQRALASLSLDTGNLEAAISWLDRSSELASASLEFDPENTQWVETTAYVWLEFGEVLLIDGDPAAAAEAFSVAAGYADRLLSREPVPLRWLVRLHYEREMLMAWADLRTGNLAAGLERVAAVRAGLGDLYDENPAYQEAILRLGTSHFLEGEFLKRLGRHEEAVRAWERAVALYSPHAGLLLLDARIFLAAVLARLGEQDQVIEITSDFERMGYRHPYIEELIVEPD